MAHGHTPLAWVLSCLLPNWPWDQNMHALLSWSDSHYSDSLDPRVHWKEGNHQWFWLHNGRRKLLVAPAPQSLDHTFLRIVFGNRHCSSKWEARMGVLICLLTVSLIIPFPDYASGKSADFPSTHQSVWGPTTHLKPQMELLALAIFSPRPACCSI